MFHHLAIKVRDLRVAESFYVGLLGLGVLRRWPAADGVGERSIWVDLGHGAFLALEKASGVLPAKPEDDAGFHLFAIAIEPADRAGIQERLAAAGFPAYQETAFTFYVRDPEGNRVGFSHWPKAL